MCPSVPQILQIDHGSTVAPLGRGQASPASSSPKPARKTEATLAEKFEAKRRAWENASSLPKVTHRILRGDARNLDQFLADEKIHLVVTSPPYWNLKRYPNDLNGAQLGHVDDGEEFLTELGRVWQHCYDHLVPGGRLCIVVGDVCRSRRSHGRHLVEPLHAHIQVQCQEIGFDPLAPIIWYKIANATTEVRGNGTTFLGKPYEPNAIIKNDIEFILLFRKPGGYRHPTPQQRELSLIDKEDHRRWFQQVWSDLPGQIQRDHPAPYPVEVARRLIGMFSFVGDTVLDPFSGLANTTVAAMKMHRSSVGVEIDPDFIKTVRKKLSERLINENVEFIG